jgi:hypothetical protein
MEVGPGAVYKTLKLLKGFMGFNVSFQLAKKSL